SHHSERYGDPPPCRPLQERREEFSHLQACSVQPGIDRRFAQVQDLGSLCGAHVLHIPQDEYGPITFAETVQSVDQCRAEFLLIEFVGGDVAPLNKLAGLELTFFDLAFYRVKMVRSALAAAHASFVCGNLQKPRLETFTVAQLLEMRKGLEHSFLDDFLCIFVILQDGINEESYGLEVGSNERVKLLFFTRFTSADEVQLMCKCVF